MRTHKNGAVKPSDAAAANKLSEVAALLRAVAQDGAVEDWIRSMVDRVAAEEWKQARRKRNAEPSLNFSVEDLLKDARHIDAYGSGIITDYASDPATAKLYERYVAAATALIPGWDDIAAAEVLDPAFRKVLDERFDGDWMHDAFDDAYNAIWKDMDPDEQDEWRRTHRRDDRYASDLRSAAIRIASTLPAGDVTRRRLLAALSRG